MSRLSGPGTRRKNPDKYDRYAADHNLKKANAGGNTGPVRGRQLRKLGERQHSRTLSVEGRLSGRRMNPEAYRMPGSVTK